ncbi:uncharacterized protein LOC129001833 [Macrosteles quadrilineatus]|uniref:uncharacterized protein LOC129001833 n=1 Tax=Macrosteles quadrilineatus TaxID=74068 RepID=UPI0023E2CA0D|nr:uncharacterized protein LOC129001833 [Macrosteles quadrilineatus]
MSGTGVKFSDLIKQYDGSGDFSEWLKKLELVCKLQKVKDLQTVLPLFLAGGAFSVYDGLAENVKSNYEALTNALLQAFSANCFQAYAEFTARRLLPGESLDVYASDLKRLAKLVDPFVSDEWIKSAVVHGLPEDTQTQLKAACSLQSMELSDVMTRARNLLGSESNFGAVAQANAKVFKVVLIRGVPLKLSCLVASVLPRYQMLLGMDAVTAMGGVTIDGDGTITFRDVDIGAMAEAKKELCVKETSENGNDEIAINDCDFNAKFVDGKWTVEWNWKDGGKTPKINNQVPSYSISKEAREAFDAEVHDWIRDGWLQPYDGEFDGLIPLMAVVQHNKDKVRPVMDYRELNQYVSSHTAESEVCGEKLRMWRKLGEHVSTIDLRKAYLQIHIAPHLWKFQVVRFKDKNYCLTRLGFGLNVAPKIMSKIVNKVLSMDPIVRSATDSYVDDIVVNENIVGGDVVKKLLEKYGLSAKPVEPLDGSRVLGLNVSKRDGKLMWTRDNKIKALDKIETKRDVYSLCGQLIGHFPVAGWLRPACSFLKRQLADLKWDDVVGNRIKIMLGDIMESIKEKDPVFGKWAVSSSDKGTVWCDASSLAIGICIEIDGEIVEDASWLRKEDDSAHINLAELEALLKGVNLALKWNLKELYLVTDSATVYAWVTSILTGDRRIKTHGMGEALVRRRLGLLKDLISECGLKVRMDLVKSQFNKADRLTRVPKKWLAREEEKTSIAMMGEEEEEKTSIAMMGEEEDEDKQKLVKRIHGLHHFGVNRTLFTVRRCYPAVEFSKQDVDCVVKSCKECLSVDPSPIKWKPGHLDCDKNWHRLAIDVTHYGSYKFLTIIDCGPSRFCIWRRIPSETKEQVVKILLELFSERGPPQELLMDNSATFRCEQIEQLCEEWGVIRRFRCVNRPSGNGIVERNHRTIKRMATRTRRSVQEMVYWYNLTPKEDLNEESTPSSRLFCYRWRCKGEPVNCDEQLRTEFSPDEPVFVKPKNSLCTTRWKPGVVSRQLSQTSVEVDGMPHHIADVRRAGVDTTGACACDIN